MPLCVCVCVCVCEGERAREIRLPEKDGTSDKRGERRTRSEEKRKITAENNATSGMINSRGRSEGGSEIAKECTRRRSGLVAMNNAPPEDNNRVKRVQQEGKKS